LKQRQERLFSFHLGDIQRHVPLFDDDEQDSLRARRRWRRGKHKASKHDSLDTSEIPSETSHSHGQTVVPNEWSRDGSRNLRLCSHVQVDLVDVSEVGTLESSSITGNLAFEAQPPKDQLKLAMPKWCIFVFPLPDIECCVSQDMYMRSFFVIL
jgi:hypothetical protein